MKIFLLTLLLELVPISAGEGPAIVFVTGEFEYHSRETFPGFAEELSRSYEVRTKVLARLEDQKIQSIPGLEQLEKADLLVLMIRRMTLPEDQLNRFKKYLDAGKPLVALRTASHSFENWQEFDHRVLGGNYGNHFGNDLKPLISALPGAREHPILRGFSGFTSDGSLYRNTPLQPGTHLLLTGKIADRPAEPVAWTHQYKGGRVFYTSLGHPNDFKQPAFQNLLRQAIEWTLDQPLAKRVSNLSPR